MMNIRHVSEHVKKRKPFELLTTANTPLIFESSANAMFAEPSVTLNDISGKRQQIDHRQNLNEALKRFKTALDSARDDH